jgi:hypothetical protein
MPGVYMYDRRCFDNGVPFDVGCGFGCASDRVCTAFHHLLQPLIITVGVCIGMIPPTFCVRKARLS